jgi:hypothetical protein
MDSSRPLASVPMVAVMAMAPAVMPKAKAATNSGWPRTRDGSDGNDLLTPRAR